MSDPSPQEHVDARILAYYGSEFDEGDRLVGRSGQGVLEFERTQQIVGERVPAGAHIIDIGGASGLHAAALARRGDHVLLIDPVPRHVEAARRYGTFTAQLGDARSLPVDDDSFDAALLLGPLYHLCERSDRLRAATAASPAAISTWPTTSRRRPSRPGCATCELSGSRGQAPRRSRSAGHTTRR